MNKVHTRNLQRRFSLPAADFAALARAVLAREGEDDVEFTVIYCNEERMTSLNSSYRHKDGPTDVLSFPDGVTEEEGLRYLGDVFICPAVAKENALEYGVPFAREMAELHIHGVLHLLGWDHEEDEGEMMARQTELVEELAALFPELPDPS